MMKAKANRTRLWSILLTLVMLAGLLPTTALAAESATADFTADPAAALALLNAAKTGETDSEWNSETKTLTLNGVNFETTAVDAVHLPGGTTIVLTDGTVNTITGGPAVKDVNGGWCCGIRVDGDLTISGDGSLTVISGDASATNGVSAGIFSHVSDTNQGSTVCITGGTVVAKSGPAKEHSYGILAGWTGYGNMVLSGTANVTATGGDMVSDGVSAGIYAKRNYYSANGGYVTISDTAQVTAQAGNNGGKGYGIYSRSVTISGSARVNAEGGKAGWSQGIFALEVVRVSGSAQVTATGKEGYGSAGICGEGTYTSAVYISENAHVTTTGGNAGDQSYGIYVYKSEISGGTLIATAGTVTYAPEHYTNPNQGNAGIYSSNEVKITGGTVTAMAGPVIEADGSVQTESGGIRGNVKISGGTVTAAGNPTDSTATLQTAGGYKNSFNGNGGTGQMSFTKATSGEYTGYTLPANGFTAPVGMKFKAWEVNDVEKAVGSPIDIDDTTVVKALWEYINYNVTVTNGTASVDGSPISTAIYNKAVTLTASEIPGKVFDKWVVESGDVTLADATSATTTFTMPAGDVCVKATYLDVISSVAITDITAPVSNTALDTTAACATTGVSTTEPTVTWTPSVTNADYGTAYTASVTLTAGTGYIFADEVAATVNDNTASVTKNDDGTLTVTYAFPKTADKILIPSVAITGVTAPVPGQSLNYSKSCETTGVSSTSIGWSPYYSPVKYSTTYTVTVRVWAEDGYKFDNSTTATINGNSAVITYRSETYLEVKYSFTTAKHDIQITFDNTVSDGDPVVAPTINDGYAFYSWRFCEDTNKNGDFTDDVKTIVVDEATLEAEAVRLGKTPEETIAYYASSGYTVKTTFTGGYTYGLYAYIERSDGKYFAKGDNGEVIDAIVTVNGKDVTAQCTSTEYEIKMMPNVCSFTVEGAAKTLSSIAITTPPTKTTYTAGETFDTTGMEVTATYSDSTTAAVSGYTVTPDRTLTTSDTSVTVSYTEGGVTKTITQAITVNPAPTTGGSYTPPTYKVESAVSEDADGSVSFSKSNAKKGDTVTITVTPDRYYKVDGVTVTDKNGKEIAVTDNGDGTFTFKMPDSQVTVEPEFSWDNPFVDVADDAYYASAVEWALKNDVTEGTGDGTTFSPNDGCTRAQIVTFLWRAAGCPEPVDMGNFTDVPADAYYAKAVAWAVEQGITDGTGNGKFSPDAICTRSQSVTFLYRTAGSPEVSDNASFSDVEPNAYYAAAVAWAEQNDVTGGIGGGLFGSANECTRAQIVAFLYRYFVK